MGPMIAFVFAGQGAQHPGMGLELAQTNAAAAQVFQTLDSLRPGTAEQCFHGTESALKDTAVTQPCLFAVEMAAAAALTDAGIRSQVTAGFSLGELAALTYSGSADLETGFRLVCQRGQLMSRAASETPSAMAAVLKLTDQQVEAVCAQFPDAYPVNYNCPGQVSVAMRSETLKPFSAAVKAAGGRALPLKVQGGFHSPFMARAATEFGAFLADIPLKTPRCPLYSNATGALYTEDIRGLLARQIDHPVRWETIVRSMVAAGVDTFIELGPGTTLCNLITKIHPAARTYPLSTPADLETIRQEVPHAD